MKVDPEGQWPECLYTGKGSIADGEFEKEPEKKLCGERSAVSVHSGWTNLCDCPSCPIKVAIATALSKHKSE